MGRVALVIVIFMALLWCAWLFPHQMEFEAAKIVWWRRNDHGSSFSSEGYRDGVVDSKWQVPQQRKLLQVKEEKEQVEAANSTGALITHTATKNTLSVELPPNSNCSNSLNWLCPNGTDTDKCYQPEKTENNTLFTIRDLVPSTLYVLKSNETLSDCETKMYTCSDQMPVVQDLNISPGPDHLDIKWSPPEEKCNSTLIYLFRMKVDDSPFTEWEDVRQMKRLMACEMQLCIRITNASGNLFIAQMKVRRFGEVWVGSDGGRGGGGGGGGGVGGGGGGKGVVEARVHARSETAPGSNAPRRAWLSALWVALGAVVLLAFVTLLAVCYFDKRARDRAAAEEEKLAVAKAVGAAQAAAALGLDTMPLVDNETFPFSLPPEEIPPPAEQPRPKSYSLRI